MYERENGTSALTSFVVFLLIGAFIVVLALSLWPTRDSRSGATMTDSSSRAERAGSPSAPEPAKAPTQQ